LDTSYRFFLCRSLRRLLLLIIPLKMANADAQSRRIGIEYEPPKNPAHQPLYEMLKEHRVLEKLQEIFSPFQLPIEVTFKIARCDGVSNAWYSRPTVLGRDPTGRAEGDDRRGRHARRRGASVLLCRGTRGRPCHAGLVPMRFDPHPKTLSHGIAATASGSTIAPSASLQSADGPGRVGGHRSKKFQKPPFDPRHDLGQLSAAPGSPRQGGHTLGPPTHSQPKGVTWRCATPGIGTERRPRALS